MRSIAAAAALLLVSCSQGRAPESSTPESALNREILAIAREYSSYPRLSNWSGWSPIDCRLPTPELDRSASDDDLTHGRKLYYLFAREEKAYRRGRAATQPDGQAIVKEAWEPMAVRPRDPQDGSNTVAIEGPGKEVTHFKAGPKAGLFVMLKQGGQWNYATVSADATRVLQSGQIESCLGCHRKAPHDSLFGNYMEQADPMQRSR